MSCSGQKDGLALNHPPLVIAVVGDDGAVPKEGNSVVRRGEGNASLPQKTEDAPPSILVFLRENVAEHIPQYPPLKEGCAVGAEPVIDLRKGRDKFGRAELVRQFEQHGGVGVDGVVVIDDGHSSPFPLLSQGRLCYICCRDLWNRASCLYSLTL